jgi:hypothetical protein
LKEARARLAPALVPRGIILLGRRDLRAGKQFDRERVRTRGNHQLAKLVPMLQPALA